MRELDRDGLAEYLIGGLAVSDISEGLESSYVSLAREQLGWAPRRSLRASLPRMAAAVLEDPGRWYRENGLKHPPSIQRAYPAAATPKATPR